MAPMHWGWDLGSHCVSTYHRGKKPFGMEGAQLQPRIYSHHGGLSSESIIDIGERLNFDCAPKAHPTDDARKTARSVFSDHVLGVFPPHSSPKKGAARHSQKNTLQFKTPE